MEVSHDDLVSKILLLGASLLDFVSDLIENCLLPEIEVLPQRVQLDAL